MLLAPLLVLAVAAPPKGRWSVDETGKVPAAALSEFDQVAAELDARGTGQLGLAVVSSTHGENPRQFATRVFNQWGVGHAGRNDGVLLFFALDDRKSEIVYGDGFSGFSPTTDAIMRDDVVANMKQGRLDLAVTRSARSLAAVVQSYFAAAPATAEPDAPEPDIKERSPRGWTLELDHPLTPAQTAALDREGDRVYASGKGLLFVAVYDGALKVQRFAERLRTKLNREDVWVVFVNPAGGVVVDAPGAKRIYEDVDRTCSAIEHEESARLYQAGADIAEVAREAMHRAGSLVINGPPTHYEVHLGTYELLGGFGFTGLLGFVMVRSWNRRRPRRCDGCGHLRHKLSEETDDPHLNPGQRLEEQLGSVDYDVWWCGRCNDALVLRYGAIFTRYGMCRGCGHKTMTSSSVTLVHATYDHGGTVEVTERCEGCPRVHTYTRYTAQLTRSDDSSSSSWSSSSDSSFGGGSSSGGGSSGSW